MVFLKLLFRGLLWSRLLHFKTCCKQGAPLERYTIIVFTISEISTADYSASHLAINKFKSELRGGSFGANFTFWIGL